MKIKDIGGEFALIKRLTSGKVTDKNVIVGVGDDCAVLCYTKDKYTLVTTDMLVENDHFKLKWQSPFQIGKKLMECNVSDIVAMGGIPKYAFVSVSIKKNTSVEFMDKLYAGIKFSAKKHDVLVLGGDTTHGTEYVFNICLVGEVEKKYLCLRSDAKVGDLICVTGTLGGSCAGLNLLLSKKKGYLLDYLEPESRLVSDGQRIARYANAMIDVSDGLASEVKHICEESKVGAVIYYENVPLSKNTIKSSHVVSKNPYEYALYGGEDFELVFTVNERDIVKLRKEFNDFTVVGKVLPKKNGVYLSKSNKKMPLKKGYDHFG